MDWKIYVIIAALLACSISAVMLSEPSAAADEEVLYLEFGDYVETRAKSASGALELVYIDDVRYLHACGVGAGTYQVGHKVYRAEVSKADLYVFLIFGQSNAGYFPTADPSKAEYFTDIGQIFYFGTEDKPVYGPGQWDPENIEYGMFDMMETPTRAHIGSIEEPFAATLNSITGKKVLTINAAIGGSHMSRWQPGGTAYNWAQTLFAAAIDSVDTDGFNIKAGGLIWSQGEQDPTLAIDSYKERFMAMFDTLKHAENDYGYFSDDYVFDKVVISLVRQYRGVNSCCSQIELVAQNKDIYFGCIVCDQFSYENGLLLSDNTHYTQYGRNIDGHDIGLVYSRLIK